LEELDRVLRQLPGVDPALRRRLEHFSRSLVNRLLHQPTERLRVEAGNGHAAEYARIARELFGLGEADGHHEEPTG
jgi:glutamyl-tRNA reductase